MERTSLFTWLRLQRWLGREGITGEPRWGTEGQGCLGRVNCKDTMLYLVCLPRLGISSRGLNRSKSAADANTVAAAIGTSSAHPQLSPAPLPATAPSPHLCPHPKPHPQLAGQAERLHAAVPPRMTNNSSHGTPIQHSILTTRCDVARTHLICRITSTSVSRYRPPCLYSCGGVELSNGRAWVDAGEQEGLKGNCFVLGVRNQGRMQLQARVTRGVAVPQVWCMHSLSHMLERVAC